MALRYRPKSGCISAFIILYLVILFHVNGASHEWCSCSKNISYLRRKISFTIKPSHDCYTMAFRQYRITAKLPQYERMPDYDAPVHNSSQHFAHYAAFSCSTEISIKFFLTCKFSLTLCQGTFGYPYITNRISAY